MAANGGVWAQPAAAFAGKPACMFTRGRPRKGLSGWRDEARIWPVAQTVGEFVPPLTLNADKESIGSGPTIDGKPAFGEAPTDHSKLAREV